jgi:hypothetical protein
MDVDDALVLTRTLMRQHRLRGWIVEINPRLRVVCARTGHEGCSVVRRRRRARFS